ncbi:MAG: hypothetical protein ACYDD4_06720 [Acidimicrobiales bacterium]
MASQRAELSSLTSALEELTRRIAAMAESAASDHDEELATELFTVERALRGAARRLVRVAGPGPRS